MTRNQLLVHLERNEIGNILFHFYSSRCKELGLNIIEPKTFLTIYSQWQFSDYYTERVLNYYFEKFEIIRIEQQGKKTLYI